jgi:hypothetical protein
MRCNHCKKNILNQLSSVFWSGTTFGAMLLLIGLFYFGAI